MRVTCKIFFPFRLKKSELLLKNYSFSITLTLRIFSLTSRRHRVQIYRPSSELQRKLWCTFLYLAWILIFFLLSYCNFLVLIFKLLYQISLYCIVSISFYMLLLSRHTMEINENGFVFYWAVYYISFSRRKMTWRWVEMLLQKYCILLYFLVCRKISVCICQSQSLRNVLCGLYSFYVLTVILSSERVHCTIKVNL